MPNLDIATVKWTWSGTPTGPSSESEHNLFESLMLGLDKVGVPLLDGYVRPALISSPTGVGAELVTSALAAGGAKTFRGDRWGTRFSHDSEEWTYRVSQFQMPDPYFTYICSMTDGSDFRPYLRFKAAHPHYKTIRLVCSREDLLKRRNRWRIAHDLPPVTSLGDRVIAQLENVGGADAVISWPDIERQYDEAVSALAFIVSLIRGSTH